VLDDLPPAAAKTGALGTVEIIEALAERAAHFSFPLVVDPVMISKHGAPLLAEAARETLIHQLLPHATLVTPNVYEASALAGRPVDDAASAIDAARAIAQLGPKAVLLKGGHLPGEASDLLYAEGECHWFPARRIDTQHTHGTGCTYSAAITSELAKGANLRAAVETAKRFITLAIETNPGLGHGTGPVNHHAQV
jgi:hydroxymethylpyrimidine/phosphomethylpyrimidine kinase